MTKFIISRFLVPCSTFSSSDAAIVRQLIPLSARVGQALVHSRIRSKGDGNRARLGVPKEGGVRQHISAEQAFIWPVKRLAFNDGNRVLAKFIIRRKQDRDADIVFIEALWIRPCGRRPNLSL